jgi:hypothetical protein
MTSRRAAGVKPSRLPIPNYGRGAFFGMISMLIAGVAWPIANELSGEFNLGTMLLMGWLVGWAVKRGMGTVDRVGVGIALYGTLVSILIGTYLHLGVLIHDQGGTVTVEAIAGAFWIALGSLTFVAIFGGFAVGACWLAVAVCKEGMPEPSDLKTGNKDEGEQNPPIKR